MVSVFNNTYYEYRNRTIRESIRDLFVITCFVLLITVLIMSISLVFITCRINEVYKEKPFI